MQTALHLDWSTFPEYFLIGAIGAACLEFLKLAERFGKLSESRFKRMVRSRYFKVFTAGAIVIPGILAWARYAWTKQVPSSPFDLMTTGLAATAAFRQVAAATEANKKTVLGHGATEPTVKEDVLL